MRKLAAACNNKTPEYEKRSRIEPLAVPRTLARQTRGPWTVSADPRRRLSTCGSERQAAEKMRSCNMLIACDASKEPGFHPHQCLKHSLRRGHAKWIQRPAPTQQEFARRLERTMGANSADVRCSLKPFTVAPSLSVASLLSENPADA